MSGNLNRSSRRNRLISRCAGCVCQSLERRVLLSHAIPVGPEFRVNAYTTSAQGVESVAMDAAGNFVVVWSSDGQDGSTTSVYARRFDALGAAQAGEFRVNTYTTGLQMQSAVAMDADGDFVVTWISDSQPGGDGWDIYAQRFNAGGVPQGSEFRVNNHTTFTQWLPAATMDADGDFIIVWNSLGQDGSSSGVFARRYDATGQPQGGDIQVNTFTPGSQGGNNNPASVAMDPQGNFVVAWQSYGQDGTSGSIYAQLYYSDGVPHGKEFRVNTFTTGGQITSATAMDSNGNFVIAWMSNLQDGSDWGVYAQRYDREGVRQGDEFRVNTFTTGVQRSPRAAMDDDGNFVIAWQGAGPGDSYGVFARCYNAAGISEGGEFRVNTYTTSFQSGASVAMDADGDFVIGWSSAGQDGSGPGAYAQRFAVVPEVTSEAFVFDSAPQRLTFGFSRDVAASLTVSDFLVQNLSTGQTIPASDFALSYDALTNFATLSYSAGVLPDGNYRATIIASGITTPQGAALANNHIFDFFFLNGDANHDGVVNLQDFNRLAANFGHSGPGIDFTKGDFNYDGIVNLADFNILAGRFGSMLSPAGRISSSGGRLPAGPSGAPLGDSSIMSILDDAIRSSDETEEGLEAL